MHSRAREASVRDIPLAACPPHFRLSFVTHLRYKGPWTACPLSTPSAARRLGL